MNLIAGVDVTAGALNAQKTRLDIVAQNIANAQTTRTANGTAYQRQVVSFESELVRRTDQPDWPWCEDRVTYCNARLPQALIAELWSGPGSGQLSTISLTSER